MDNEYLEKIKNYEKHSSHLNSTIDYYLKNNPIEIYNKLYEEIDIKSEAILLRLLTGDFFFEKLFLELQEKLTYINKEVEDYILQKNLSDIEISYILHHKPEIVSFLNTVTKNEAKINKLRSEKNISLKWEILLNFANGKIYDLHKQGVSHPKKAKQLFRKQSEQNKSIEQYIKCTYSNNQNDMYNKNKNLYNDLELVNNIKNHCLENNIKICEDFSNAIQNLAKKIELDK